jgi:hypothetical protein
MLADFRGFVRPEEIQAEKKKDRRGGVECRHSAKRPAV